MCALNDDGIKVAEIICKMVYLYKYSEELPALRFCTTKQFGDLTLTLLIKGGGDKYKDEIEDYLRPCVIIKQENNDSVVGISLLCKSLRNEDERVFEEAVEASMLKNFTTHALCKNCWKVLSIQEPKKVEKSLSEEELKLIVDETIKQAYGLASHNPGRSERINTKDYGTVTVETITPSEIFIDYKLNGIGEEYRPGVMIYRETGMGNGLIFRVSEILADDFSKKAFKKSIKEEWECNNN